MTTLDLSAEILTRLGREPTEQELAMLYDFRNENGIANKLWKKIGNVNIDHPAMVRAFRDFIEKSGDAISSFRLIDLLSFQESVCKKSFAYGKVGDYILCFSQTPKDRKFAKKVFRDSVNGIYELIDRTNGFAIDIAALSTTDIGVLANRRFVFADEKKKNTFFKKALAEGISVYKLGLITIDKQIVIMNNGISEINIEKSLLIPTDNEEFVTADISDNMLEDFKKGYLSVLYYKYGVSAFQNFPIVLGADGSISQMLAMLLGIYTATKALSIASVKLLFSSGTDITLSIGAVNFHDGDRVYLIKPSCNSDGVPFVDSFNRINSYLTYRAPQIAVCPVVKDIQSSLGQIMNDDFYFEPSSYYDKHEYAKASVLVVCPNEIDGKLIGFVRRK